jgi:hypothetical protein
VSRSVRPKWIISLESKIRLPFGDLVNVIVLIVSLFALFIATTSLNVSIKSLNSSEKSGSEQLKVLESSRNSLKSVSDNLNTQTNTQFKQYNATLKAVDDQQKVLNTSRRSLDAVNVQTSLLLKQYNKTLLKPKVRAYFWNFKDKVQLFPEEVVYDEKTETARGRGPTTSSPKPVDLKIQPDGLVYFDVYIDNVGDRDLVQANIAVSCNVPIETYSLGVTGHSEPLTSDPLSGYWTIYFSRALLNPMKQLAGGGVSYKFSTAGPFPTVWAPKKMFGCFVTVRAPDLDPFTSGGFLQVVD